MNRFLKFCDAYQDKAETIFSGMTNTFYSFLEVGCLYHVSVKKIICISINLKQFKDLLSLSKIFDLLFIVKIMKTTFFRRSRNVYLKINTHVFCSYNQ